MVRAPATALPAFVPLAVAGNAAIAATILGRGAGLTIAVAVAPAALLALAALVVSTRVALLVPALALSISAEPLNRAYPLAGGLQVVAADVVVALAIGAWAVSRALGAPSDARRGRTASPTLGWPLALFALATLTAVLRGHERYGESLFGQPVRLLLYASVALTISQASARQVYRIIVGVFYVGTVWMMLNAAYHIATGTSQTGAVALSTGGTRVLSISVSMYMAAALFLALLNLRDDESAARRGLHLTIACLAAVGVILGYGRAIFAGVALVLVLFLFHREIRRRVGAVLPLFLPLIVLAAILGLQAAPNVLPAFIDRVTASPAQDTNVEWREQANAAVFEQVRESPLIGVGFMWFFVQTPLYATIWALLLGYIATYLPYGIRPLASAFVQIHSHLEESSQVCGARPLTTMRRIIVPLLVPGIVSAWILMATMFVRELTLSVVLSRPGTEVLAVQILRFADDGLWGRLSALGIIMIGISTSLVVIATPWLRQWS